jgi:D-lactate dehydrogenase
MATIAFYGIDTNDEKFFAQEFAQAQHTVHWHHGKIELDSLDPSTEVLSVFVTTPVTRQIIQALPKLRFIATRSTGIDHIDLQAAREHNITIANVPAYGSSTVAEYTFVLLLMLTRHMPEVLHQVTSTDPNRSLERGTDLYGKTIGIIGTGKIGLCSARIAKGFGMQILGYDVKQNPAAAAELGFDYTDIKTLLAKSDVITLHIPYVPENHHFLDKTLLNHCKPGAILINTARGELVDTGALVQSLKKGQLSAAALDVLESEYLLDPDELVTLAIHDDAAKATLRHAVSLAALQRMPNVLITNHNAYNTAEAVQRINQTIASRINDFLAGKAVLGV